MIASNANRIIRNAPSRESFGILALLSVLIAVPAFLMIRVLEPELVLPAFSILLFAEAAIAAIVARSIQVHRSSENVTLWDIAGAFTMMGCAAAIFSEPDQAAQFFEQSVEQHPDTPL
jgi:predicted permease